MVRGVVDSTSYHVSREDAGESLMALVGALIQERWLFSIIFVIGSAASVFMVVTAPRLYVASTVLLQPQQQSAAAGAIAQLGALSGVAGAALGNKAPDELYVSLLKTRRLLDALIDRFNLKERYKVSTYIDARQLLLTRVVITPEKKSGLITIEVDDEDAAFAAELANAYVEELSKLLSKIAVTDAQQRRMFYEQQVAKTKATLTAAEVAFRQAQAESGFVVSQSLAEGGVKAAVELRSQIAMREIQLRALGRFATPLNVESQKLTAELAALRQQLTKVEQGDASSSAGAVPQRGMVAVQAYRDMKVQEASMEILIKMLEAARLDESREGPLLQQVDVAVPPERPAKPQRLRSAMSGAAMAALIGAMIAIGRALLSRKRAVPNSAIPPPSRGLQNETA